MFTYIQEHKSFNTIVQTGYMCMNKQPDVLFNQLFTNLNAAITHLYKTSSSVNNKKVLMQFTRVVCKVLGQVE